VWGQENMSDPAPVENKRPRLYKRDRQLLPKRHRLNENRKPLLGVVYPEIDPNREYTYADTLEWDEGFHCELFNGEVFEMAEPIPCHEEALIELLFQIRPFFNDKPCRALASHVSVRQFANPEIEEKDDKRNDKSFVVPDIFVVCDKKKRRRDGVVGAPDFIIEILSPSDPNHDRVRKFNSYLKAGVLEYWIFDPDKKILFVNVLKNARYDSAEIAVSDMTSVPVSIFPGLALKFKPVLAAMGEWPEK
jgi:Uma2 family endonuclease